MVVGSEIQAIYVIGWLDVILNASEIMNRECEPWMYSITCPYPPMFPAILICEISKQQTNAQGRRPQGVEVWGFPLEGYRLQDDVVTIQCEMCVDQNSPSSLNNHGLMC